MQETPRPPRDFYFDSVAGLASNTGTSEASPLKDIGALNSIALVPGDAIRLRAGSSWNRAVYLKGAGSADAPITVAVWESGAAPELSCGVDKKPALTVMADYVTLEGIHITGAAAAAGIYFDADARGVTVRDCEITNAGMGVSVRGSDHVIEDCYIHDLKMIVDTAGGDDDYGAVGIRLFDASRVRIEGNRFVNCKAPSHDYDSDGGVIESWGSAKDIEFCRNYSEGNNGFFELGGPNGETVENVSIHHNISMNDVAFFVPHLSGSFAVKIKNVAYACNTFYCDVVSPHAAFVAHGMSLSAEQLSVVNNAIITKNPVYDLVDGGFDHRGNLYYGIDGADTGLITAYLHTTERIADPKIDAINATGYAFLSGSPLVDTGVTVSCDRDYAGSTTPVNGQYDIGALEKR